MVALRKRLGLPETVPWRAPVSSCVALPGDDVELDLEEIRAQARALAAAEMSADARAVEAIIREWVESKDDKTFSMKMRYFPTGVKPEGAGGWTL